jgi:hypothetical protein
MPLVEALNIFDSPTKAQNIVRCEGQQQIVVKHVTTVNADQAVISESIVAGKTAGKDTSQLAAGADTTMQIIESSQKEAVPVGGGWKTK